MFSNIAECSRPEESICDGVQYDVGVAVAGEPAAMGHCNTTEHDGPFAGERVHVKSHSGSRDGSSSNSLFGPAPIIRSGQFFQLQRASNPSDFEPGSTGNR